jgi:hypothetical protein
VIFRNSHNPSLRVRTRRSRDLPLVEVLTFTWRRECPLVCSEFLKFFPSVAVLPTFQPTSDHKLPCPSDAVACERVQHGRGHRFDPCRAHHTINHLATDLTQQLTPGKRRVSNVRDSAAPLAHLIHLSEARHHAINALGAPHTPPKGWPRPTRNLRRLTSGCGYFRAMGFLH